jgi:hypothetical protein
MRNLSNIISVSQLISFSDALWSVPQTAKIDAFFGIAEFFTYRNAQITIKVNVLFPCNINPDRDTGGDEKGQMAARTRYVLR